MIKDYSNTNILGLSYPVITLSPMDGVSDSAYRQITRKYSTLANGGKTAPDLMITEFTHVMGLCYAAENVLHHFKYQEMERPLIAQIYGAEPEYFYHAAKLVCALGFDGVDINMGCPAATVASSGAGAGLIRTPEKAKIIIEETKRGVADWVADGKVTGMKNKGYEYLMELIEEYRGRLVNSKLSGGQINLFGEKRVSIPVSVKTRIGYDEIITEKWIKHISDQKPYFISVHGRTLKQAYGGEANWDELKKAVEISEVPVLTNGDIKVYSDIKRMLEHTGSFGVQI
jgi:tRNA-dihydrouridine synthase B